MSLDLTPEQWAQIDALVPACLERQQSPLDREKSTYWCGELYKAANMETPLIVYADSPFAANLFCAEVRIWADGEADLSLEEAVEKIGDRWNSGRDVYEEAKALYAEHGEELVKKLIRDQLPNLMHLYWQIAYLEWFRAGAIAGVTYDPKLFNFYEGVVDNISTLLPYQNMCFISERPSSLRWQDRDLHNTEGPAIEYVDKFGWYALEGYQVPKHVVMAPQTQTIKEIAQEDNAELKRIRINQFGWTNYLERQGATVLDTQIIHTENGSTWFESLMQLTDAEDEDMAVLVTYDPSTGRQYSLEVDPDTLTTKQAQKYLLSPDLVAPGFGLKPGELAKYPLIRT